MFVMLHQNVRHHIIVFGCDAIGGKTRLKKLSQDSLRRPFRVIVRDFVDFA